MGQKFDDEVSSKFLEETSGFRPIALSVKPNLLCGPGMARIWPHRDKADGFFIAGFERYQ